MSDKDTGARGGADAGASGKLGRTVLDDLNQIDFRRTMREDLQDVYQFYLDEGKRSELAEMDQFSRWIHMTGWLMKNSILRLSPLRRLLLLAGMLLFVHGIFGNGLSLILGFLLLLLTLMLELKDKLLAQDELMTGRAVQFALMPRSHPSLPGWETWLFTRPANEVGGDLVDYLWMEEDRLGLALGDVAGKGLGAALFMAKLQSTLRAIAANYTVLADLGRAINRIFIRDGLPDRFISLVYLTLTPDAGRVRLFNAGHPPPLVVRKGRVEELPRGGPALGLMREAVFTDQEVDLHPDDLLIIYSDGVTEARDEQGDFFEEKRLLALAATLRGLSAEDAGRRLLEAVEGFTCNARPHDDLSLIVVRRLALPVRRLGASSPAPAADVV